MGKSKRIPIKAAKEFAKTYEKDQVIILCWDKQTNTTWVTTYGKSPEDCQQAADGGNEIKRQLNWPEKDCDAVPSRTKKKVAVNFTDWLMTNCELSEDQTIWSYDSEEYSLEGIYNVFKNV